MNQITASTRLAARVAKAFGLNPTMLAAPGRRGSHGTRLEADARAAACWAVAYNYPELSRREIGEVVGLATPSVRQAVLRAPRRFSTEQLYAFAGKTFPVQP